jgi:hypothetical protein
MGVAVFGLDAQPLPVRATPRDELSVELGSDILDCPLVGRPEYSGNGQPSFFSADF